MGASGLSMFVSVKRFFSVSNLTIALIACVSLHPMTSHAVTVAGCDHVGDHCDVSPKHGTPFPIFAQKVEVWPEQQSIQAIEGVYYQLNRNVSILNNTITETTATLNASIARTKADLREDLERARAQITQTRDEIRGSLKRELQKILLAKTCEDKTVPSVGTSGRAEKVTAKLECIKSSLNKWQGVNEQGQRIPVTDGDALTREQVVQMIRSLELFLVDTDITSAQRRYITETMHQFVYFNL